MTPRQTYSTRYPWRAKIQSTIALLCLASLIVPALKETIAPASAQSITRGSGR